MEESSSGGGPGNCSNDNDCSDPTPLCNPEGVCQDGGDEDPCANDNDCNRAAGFTCDEGFCDESR